MQQRSALQYLGSVVFSPLSAFSPSFLCHSSFQNVIKRIFNVTKHQFPTLEISTKFIIDIQVKIVLKVIKLHNFIYSYQTIRDIYDKVQLDVKYLLINLSQGKKQVVDQTMYTNANISKEIEF